MFSGKSKLTELISDLAVEQTPTDPVPAGHRRSLRHIIANTCPNSPGTLSPLLGSIPRDNPQLHNKFLTDHHRRMSGVAKQDVRQVKLHTQLAETANGVRALAKNLLRATLQLAPRNIMIVTKARDNSLIYLTREMTEWLLDYDHELVVYVDQCLKHLQRFDAPHILASCPRAKSLLKYWSKKLVRKKPETFDLVVTLGGDGTVLFVSTIFQGVVPPVVLYALGSLGFLTNFKFEEFRQNMESFFDSGVRANLRMRLSCRVHLLDDKVVCEQQVLNEVVVDRGPSPYVTNLELYGDGLLLTVAQADGLIIATPTGLTAYSLSAGGLLVHPGVSAISVTPICPHTLLFRPILLPDSMDIKIKVPISSRATAWASFDGKSRTKLSKGFYMTIRALAFPFPTVILSKTEYIDLIDRNLHWNAREKQKTFSDYLSADSRRKFCSNRRTSNGSVSSLHLDVSPQYENDFDINFGTGVTSSEEDGTDDERRNSPTIRPVSEETSEVEDHRGLIFSVQGAGSKY